MKKSNPCLALSPQQQAVLTQLLPIARVATSGRVRDLPVMPRSHTLIIGPSGGGKSHLARALGTLLDLPVLIINVSSWVVLSARNEPWTFSAIADWLAGLYHGGILVLDEIDKLGGIGSPSGSSEWRGHIQLECHDLLDGVIPLATKMPGLWDESGEASVEASMRQHLATRLKERVFIVGCGAWQHAWRGRSRKLGFGQTDGDDETPDEEQIMQSIEPELRQRFRHEACWLHPMGRGDYLKVSSRISANIQEPAIRAAWNRLAPTAIERAVAAGLGMRIFEEIMLTALIESPISETREAASGPRPSLLI